MMSSETMEQTESGLLIAAFVTLGEKIDKHTEAMSRQPYNARGIRRPYSGSVFSGAAPANPLLITASTWCGVGRLWEITSIGVYLQDGHSISTGAQVDMYAGPSAGLNAPGDMPSFIMTSVVPTPIQGVIGHDKKYCYENDRIYAWIYSPVANVTYTIAGTIMDWPYAARSATEQ